MIQQRRRKYKKGVCGKTGLATESHRDATNTALCVISKKSAI